MAEENQVTIFTDFDKSMVKQNSAAKFLGRLFLRQPRGTFSQMICAFRKYGTGGQAFVNALASTDPRTRDNVASWVASQLTFNPRWVGKLTDFISQYPGIKHIKIVVLTRNITLIPQIFINRNIGWLRQATGGKFDGDIALIGNDIKEDRALGITHHRWNLLQEHNAHAMSRIMIDVIDKSRQKLLFIKSRNAFYLGDREEYYGLARYGGLVGLKFLPV